MDSPGFSALLPQMERGVSDLDLADDLKRVVKAVTATGKKGSLTLKVTVEPNGDEAVFLGVDIKTAIPVNRPSTMFFTDENGVLSRKSPRQLDLPGVGSEADSE